MFGWNRTRVWNITWRSTKVCHSSSWCSWLQCRCLAPTVCWLFQSLATSDWRCRTVLSHSCRTHTRRCAYEPCLRQALTPESCRWHLALLRPPERHGMDCKCTQYWYSATLTLLALPGVRFWCIWLEQFRFLLQETFFFFCGRNKIFLFYATVA